MRIKMDADSSDAGLDAGLEWLRDADVALRAMQPSVRRCHDIISDERSVNQSFPPEHLNSVSRITDSVTDSATDRQESLPYIAKLSDYYKTATQHCQVKVFNRQFKSHKLIVNIH